MKISKQIERVKEQSKNIYVKMNNINFENEELNTFQKVAFDNEVIQNEINRKNRS